MRDAMSCLRPARRAWAALAVGLLLTAPGCNQLEAPAEPELTGPADQAFTVELRALPDTVNADGVSFSRVRLVLRDQNGQPVLEGEAWVMPPKARVDYRARAGTPLAAGAPWSGLGYAPAALGVQVMSWWVAQSLVVIEHALRAWTSSGPGGEPDPIRP